MTYYLKVDPHYLDALRQVNFPIKTIDDLTRRDTTSIALFSDYGPSDTNYEVYGYYLTDWNSSGLLFDCLQQVKEKYEIQQRTISYKGRKDRLKRKSFLEWINIVRSHPGLIYVLAFDKRMNREVKVKHRHKSLENQFKEAGIDGKHEIYNRMTTAMSFITVLSPYLKKKHKLAWITDKDCIIDTRERQDLLLSSLGFLCNELFNEPLSHVALMTKFNKPNSKDTDKQFDELISIADITASCLAASLQYDTINRLRCPDPETIEMIQELSKFCSFKDYKTEKRSCCVLGISIFDLAHIDGQPYYLHKELNICYDKDKDPLI